MGGWRVREKYPHEGEKERERDRGREQEKDSQRWRARRICTLSLGGGLKGGGGEGWRGETQRWPKHLQMRQGQNLAPADECTHIHTPTM